MMLCDYTGLVDYVRGDALRLPTEKHDSTLKTLSYFENRYPFNKRYLISLKRIAENAGLDVDSYKASVFGSLPPATNKSKSMKKVQRLLSSYPLIKGISVEEITKILEQELSTNEAKWYAIELHNYTFESLNEDFVESYLYEDNNRTFEDKTGEILKSIGFEVKMRPKPLGEDIRTEIEILVHVDNETICIIDAKNYREKFPLSANLVSHMASEYIPNYQSYKGNSVKYFGYVTANKFSGERHLEKISGKAKLISSDINVSGAIFSAKTLLGFLDYCLENELEKEKRKHIFLSLFTNKGYDSVIEIL